MESANESSASKKKKGRPSVKKVNAFVKKGIPQAKRSEKLQDDKLEQERMVEHVTKHITITSTDPQMVINEVVLKQHLKSALESPLKTEEVLSMVVPARYGACL